MEVKGYLQYPYYLFPHKRGPVTLDWPTSQSAQASEQEHFYNPESEA
jgi:hypothetical protein